MSILMTAGNKKVEWSPKEETLVKIASTQGEVQEEVNPLYEAAKLAVEAAKKCEKCGKKVCECKKEECKEEKKDEKVEASVKVEEKKEAVKEEPKKEAGKIPGVPDGTGPHGMGPEKGRGEGPCGKGGNGEKDDEKDVVKVDLPPVGSPEGDVVVEPVSEEKAEATKMEQAVDKIEEAVVELKEVVEEEKGELEEVEVDIPGEEVSDSEIIVQSDPGADLPVESCGMVAKGKGDVKTAAGEEEFCRFAKLSPANKQKLANYWKNMLGFPGDWVDLLTKDYEK